MKKDAGGSDYCDGNNENSEIMQRIDVIITMLTMLTVADINVRSILLC